MFLIGLVGVGKLLALTVDPLERRSLGLDLALELRFANLFQDLGELSARFEAMAHL